MPLLRSLAILLAAGLLIWAMGMKRAARQTLGRVMRSPIAVAALAMTGVSLLATILSVASRISFWGAYTRSHGAYLSLAYLAFFLGVVLLLRRPARVKQLVSIILLTSVPCVVYALLQRFGQDPLWPSRTGTVERVFSTAGNPIFLGAYLMMVAPLTLARLLQQARLVLSRPKPAAADGSLFSVLLLTAYAVLFGMQLLVLALTQSRGPLLGLCAGLCVFGMLLGLLRGARRAAAAIAATTLAVLVCLVALNVWAARSGNAGAVPWLGRLGRLLDPKGSGRARLVYWEGGMQLLKDDPVRSLLGYGPETTYLVYPKFYPPELAHLEGPESILDRLHNETLESLVTTGVLGAACILLAFLFFFHRGLSLLGLVAKGCRGAVFWCCVLAGGAAGLFGPWIFEGTFRLSGLGLPLGMVAGIVAYLTALAGWPRILPKRSSGTRRVGDTELLLVAVVSAVVAHFVEIQFGIAIVATRLLWWACLGLVVSMRLWPRAPDEADADWSWSGSAGPEDRADPPGWTSGSAATGMAMIVLIFSLFRPALSWWRQMPAVLVVLGSTWLAGMVLAAGHGKGKWRRLQSFAATTIMSVLLFSTVYLPWAGWRPASAVKLVDWVSQQSHATSVLYAAVFLIVLLSAMRRGRTGWAGLLRPWGNGAIVLGLLAATAAAVVLTNLPVSRADSFARQGRRYEQARVWKAAAVLFGEASRIQPRQDYYVARRALCLMAEARSQGRSDRSPSLLREAADLLSRAIELSGRDFRHHRALARTYHLESLLTEGTVERQTCADRAEKAYVRTLSLAPNHVTIRNEWASLWFDHGQYTRAAEILQETLHIDPSWAATRLLLAKVHAAAGDKAKALVELDRATAEDKAPPEIWHEKARILAGLGELEPAISAARRAVEGDPKNAAYRKTLAELLQALEELQKQEVPR